MVSPSMLYLSLASSLLDLNRCLTLDTGSATEGEPSILHGVALNVVPLPGLLSQQQSRDAGHDAAKQHEEDARLSEIIGCCVSEAGVAEAGTAADSTVAAAVAKTLFPSSSFSHPPD